MTRVKYKPSVDRVLGVAAAYPFVLLTLIGFASAQAPGGVQTVPGMPAVVDAANIYSETAADKMRPDVAKALARIYVPNRRSNDVTVIDPATMKVVDRFPVGINP